MLESFSDPHRYLLSAILVMALPVSFSSAAVRINEICAESSDRLLRWSDDNHARLGVGPGWYESQYDDQLWASATGPVGFGTSGVTTDLSNEMGGLASLYLRQTFSVSAGEAASGQNLVLNVNYNDGFVAYLNGVEILRKNTGGTGAFVYYDQPAYNVHLSGSVESYPVGVASSLLQAGDNLLAIQVHNAGTTDGTLFMSASLNISGGSTLATAGGPWNYLAGDHEPSGGITSYSDPLPGLWTISSFDDSAWLTGAGGIGYGDGDDATDVEALVRYKAMSVYMRRPFVVNAGTAASTANLSFTVDYDDGFVAYLNGQEIARRGVGGLSGDFVPFNASSPPGHEAGTPEVITLSDASRFLVEGTNVLAIQVHNQTLGSSDMSMIADLDLAEATVQHLVRQNDLWNYFIGTQEPSSTPVSTSDEDDRTEFADWVELVNTGGAPVSLEGWSLTDRSDDPGQWVFPAVTIQPGEHKLILCTGKDIRNPAATYLHSNFKLSNNGEYLGLYAPGHVLVSEIAPGFPAQDWRYTYGWDTASSSYTYQQEATPGQINSGPVFSALPSVPLMTPDSGFYDNPVTVSITAAAPATQIYYTLDGSTPSPAQSTLYTGSFSLNTSRALRAIAVTAEGIASAPVTHNYLIDEPAAVKSLPAFCLTADWETQLHKPHGVTSVVGGQWTGSGWDLVWSTVGPDDYNIPMQRGRPYERRVHLNVLYPDTVAHTNYQADCGMRIAGSDYSRPRFQYQNLAGTWYGDPHDDKVQVNLFFRSDYGTKRFEHPLFAGSESARLKSVRMRSGKNDAINPFIIDELMRRTLQDAGQVTSVGVLSSLFVNGEFRCYYNPTPRYDETFFQEAHGSSGDFDILDHGGISEGDDLAMQELMSFIDSNNLSNPDNYREIERRVDIENIIDYLIVNCHGGTWDWPGNNWTAARERSALGRWRYYMWDAEGAYGGLSYIDRDPFTFNVITTDLEGASWPYICRLYQALHDSDIFRQHWYDRAWKHLSAEGALDTSRLTARMNALATELNPIMNHVRGTSTDVSLINYWIQNRRNPLIQQFRDAGLWFDVEPPQFSIPGGTVTNGTQITLSNPNTGGSIYFSLDGADPRGPGGAIAGTLYSVPITIDRSRHIKARVRSSSGVWGALAEETYLTVHPQLLISEMMYHPAPPPSGSPYTADDFEFIELYNAEAGSIPLPPVYIDKGIAFDFSGSSVGSIAPGAYVVLVRNLAAFSSRYNTNGMTIAGIYTGKLSDSGEKLNLGHDYFGTLVKGSYNDGWHKHTDGEGYSLTLRNLSAPGLFEEKDSWKPSSVYGGTPGQPDPDSVPEPGSVVLNELLSHTDISPVGDWVELYNTTDEPIDLSGWTLSDDGTNLAKYVIPPTTILPAHNYLLLNAANHFGHPSAAVPFAFSEHGDEAILTSSADGDGMLTGYRHDVDFDAAEREVTFGRHLRSDGKTDWTSLAGSTPGAANAYPQVGPVVLFEIHYFPTNSNVEFIQFYNLESSPQPLFDPLVPTNTWTVSGGIDYNFPLNTWIPAHSGLILASGDPVLFRATHAVPAEVPVLGPFSGSLANEGDTIKLYRTGTPDEGGIPQILVSKVEYNNKFPWPLAAQSTGPSLMRNDLMAYGNDPATWGVGNAAGSPKPTTRMDSDQDGLPDRWEAAYALPYQQPGDGLLDSDSDQMDNLSEYIAGTLPNDSNSLFRVWMVMTNGVPGAAVDTLPASGPGYEGLRRLYTVEASTNLVTSGFVPLPGAEDMEGDGSRMVVTNTASADLQYFQSKVELLPVD